MRQAIYRRLLSIIIMLTGSVCAAQGRFPVHELTVRGVYATKHGDSAVYCLLGGGTCLAPEDAGTADEFVARWLRSHPRAVVLPISVETRLLLPSKDPAP